MTKQILTIMILLIGSISIKAQSKENIKNDLLKIQEIQSIEQLKLSALEEELKNSESDYIKLKGEFDNLETVYQQTNDRLNNYLTYTAIVASIFGVLIALAGIYIGFESLRSQNRRRDAIKTLEDAKSYVNSKKTDFDELVESKKSLLQDEYDSIIQLLKEKLLNDIEFETSKVKSIVEQKSDEIKKFSIEEQSSKTIELLEKRLEFFENIGIPDDPKILFSKGKLLYEKEMYAEAISLFEKLIEKEKSHKQAYWYLGYAYAEIGKNEKSIENYKKQLELNPEDSSAMNNIALRYKAKGEFLDALEYLNQSIKLSSKKELYYTNRISLLKRLKSNERAIADYIQLISINPNKDNYYDSLIELLAKENKKTEILSYYDKAINHFKDSNLELSHKFSFNKAKYLGDNQDELDAIENFQGLIDEGYKVESCYINIADLKNNLGKTEESISILDNGIKTNPLSSALYLYKAFIESNNNIDNAKGTIKSGGELINNENFFFMGGRFFNQKGITELSALCYEGARTLISEKLKKEEIEEGDVMNYYETCIILQKPLDDFESDYRKYIVSEKYLIPLSVIDSLTALVGNFTEDEKNKALESIKSLNIEAKDKDLVNWNFEDIYWFIKTKNEDGLAEFCRSIIKYVNKQIDFEEI